MVSDALAQVLARSRSRAFTAIEEALLLRDLMDGQRLSQREAACQCGRDVSWVQRRLVLLGEVPEAVLEAVRRAQVSTWAAVRVFVPLARANTDHAQRLLASLGCAQQALSTRELTTWFARYRCAQSSQRERMVEHPRLFIDSVNECERERAGHEVEGRTGTTGGGRTGSSASPTRARAQGARCAAVSGGHAAGASMPARARGSTRGGCRTQEAGS